MIDLSLLSELCTARRQASRRAVLRTGSPQQAQPTLTATISFRVTFVFPAHRKTNFWWMGKTESHALGKVASAASGCLCFNLEFDL